MLPDTQIALARTIVKERIQEAEAQRLNREAQRQIKKNRTNRSSAVGPFQWLRRLVTMWV